MVLRRACGHNGSDALSETRVTEMPPTSAPLLSVRASQGECSISTVATCDLGGLAAGSEAFVIVTIQGTVEGDL